VAHGLWAFDVHEGPSVESLLSLITGSRCWVLWYASSHLDIGGRRECFGVISRRFALAKSTNNRYSLFAESVTVLPSKDLQLEVHRGLAGYPMYVERRMIPASQISAVIINEGLCGWNVRYYLAILTKINETQSMHVLYEARDPSRHTG
jgi:hypothetical protein